MTTKTKKVAHDKMRASNRKPFTDQIKILSRLSSCKTYTYIVPSLPESMIKKAGFECGDRFEVKREDKTLYVKYAENQNDHKNTFRFGRWKVKGKNKYSNQTHINVEKLGYNRKEIAIFGSTYVNYKIQGDTLIMDLPEQLFDVKKEKGFHKVMDSALDSIKGFGLFQ